jgi:5-methylcytosine-specific restriction enzyme A
MSVRITGKRLNEQWGIGARHALYREDGTWYHLLERFPGALCDTNGYIVFETRQTLEACSGILIGKTKNWISIADGISSLPGYVRHSR